MSGHKIKVTGVKVDPKTGKLVKKQSYQSVSEKLQRGSSKKQKPVRRTAG